MDKVDWVTIGKDVEIFVDDLETMVTPPDKFQFLGATDRIKKDIEELQSRLSKAYAGVGVSKSK